MRNDSSSPITGSTAGRVSRLAAIAAFAVSLASCAAIKIGYNNADTLALLQLDGYLDLTDEQEQTVKERVNALLAWHRTTQLRDYVAFIDKTRAKLGGRITAADVMDFNQQLNARMMTAADKAAPDIAHLALSLSPEQIDRAAKKTANDATKARREFVRLEKDSGAERAKKYGERAESWFGKLTDEQKEIIRKSLANRPTDATWWIDERERRQREFLSATAQDSGRSPHRRGCRTLAAYLFHASQCGTRSRAPRPRRVVPAWQRRVDRTIN